MKIKNKNKFNRLLLALPAVLLLATTGAQAGYTTRVSVSSAGAQGNGAIFDTVISADGRYVAFSSNANNLVAGDTNNKYDAFVRDRVTGKTTRVSVGSKGVQGNDNSATTAISADGRYVTFDSYANNLVAGDTNGNSDVFVHDRVTGKTTRVSVSSAGVQGNSYSNNASISADGRYVAFWSNANNLVAGDTNGAGDIFVRDRVTGKTTRVSVDSASSNIAISANGRYVAFWSYANNLVAGDTNGNADAFVRDRVTGKTTRVSISSAGVQGNGYSYSTAISADGRYVAFFSDADNLVAGDTNGARDAFVHDRVTGKTTRVSVSSSGAQGIDYYSSIFSGAISADGRYVAFWSNADNLVARDTNGRSDVFVHDRVTGKTTRVSVSSAGVQGNGYSNSSSAAISADGRYVAFDSYANNLVAGDTNGRVDAFVRDRLLDNTHAADLQATVTTKPASVIKGRTAHYIFKVKNNGTDSAGEVALTHIVFNGTVTGITTSQGSCSKAAVSVCRLGILAAGASAKVAVNIKAEANPLTQQISVSAAPKDNAPVSNAIKISNPVRP